MIKPKVFFASIMTALIASAILLSSRSFAAQDEWLQFSNSAQCAADMSKPTNSVFLALTFRDVALMLKELAPQIGQEPTSFIKEGNRIYKLKINLLAEKIIKGLDSKALPPISSNDAAQIRKNWQRLDSSPTAPLNNIAALSCYQVNDINNYYSHLFIRGINQSTLEELAKQFIKGSSRIKGCNQSNIEANADFYPVFNYDLKLKDEKAWQQQGFEFWASFKIYLSWAWRNVKLPEINEGPYSPVFLAAPIEEQMIVLSNGCKSIARPECNSDFLSSTELRTLFTTDRKKLDLTSSTLEMKDNIIDNNDAVDQKAQQQMAAQSSDNQWVRNFQKSYFGFTQNNLERLNQTNILFSSLVSKKGVSQLEKDLKDSYSNKANPENMYYMCMEARLIGQERPLSVFKTDLELIKKQGASLDQFLKYGLTVDQMTAVYEKLFPSLILICNDFDKALQKKNGSTDGWLNFRPWYKNYLSRYKSLTEYVNSAGDGVASIVTSVMEKEALQYVPGQCADSVDCARRIIEGMVTLNKVLLHAKTFFKTSITSAPLFNERAEKVACGLYDPWEASRLNYKKLKADVASSVLFGWSSLPIYLDVNFSPKGQPTSMNKLIEEGHVKFDFGFDQKEIRKNLTLNFGSLLNVPCSINISQIGGAKSPDAQAPYIFSGVSVNACRSHQKDTVQSAGGGVDTFKKSSDGDSSMCGQCAINFQQATTFIADKTFAPLRFILRLAASLQRYHSAKEDDVINPRQFNVNAKYLVATYKKFNSIPEACVSMLTRGLSCQSNMCEALAVREFELKAGLDVESVQLVKNMESSQNEYTMSYFKVKGCAKEIGVPLRCVEGGDNFYLSYSPRMTQTCQKGAN